jgi:hypothetical protein
VLTIAYNPFWSEGNRRKTGTMPQAKSIHPRQLAWIATVCAVFVMTGCGDGNGPGAVVPVKGQVNLGGQPVTAGIVTFTPDKARGNNSEWPATGIIEKDGSYALRTEKKDGAPPGWYNVSINPYVPPPADAQPGTPLPAPAAIDRRYMDPNSSGISFEVTDSPGPGAYDINLKQ